MKVAGLGVKRSKPCGFCKGRGKTAALRFDGIMRIVTCGKCHGSGRK